MPVSASSQQEFSDADWRAVSSGDQSKKLKFLLSAISANTTRVWTVPDADVTISAFVATLLDDADAAAALATLGIVVGTYTPTLTNVANVDSSSAATWIYVRIGSVVVLAGSIDVDATASATTTTVGISIPVASAFASSANAAGTGTPNGLSGGAGVDPWAIYADTANARLNARTVSSTTTNKRISIIAMYLVI